MLAPRLTVHPSYVRQPDRWIDPALHFAVLDRSDAEGLGRDDPGSQFPERTMERARAGDGADIELVGERSTQWYSGAGTDPMVLVPGRAAARGAVGEVLQGVAEGSEVGLEEIVALFGARGPEVAAVAEAADDLRRSIVGDDVTWGGQPQHQLHQRVHVQVPLLRLLQGSPVAEPERHPVPARDLRDRATHDGGLRAGRHRGVPAGRDPSRLRRRLLHRRGPSGACRSAGDPHPRVHRAGGDRGRAAQPRAAARLPAPLDGRRTAVAAGHSRGDPRRRGPGSALPRQDHHRRVAGVPSHCPRRRAALQRDDHVRIDRATRALGPAHAAHPDPAGGDRRVHRVRRPALRAYGVAHLPSAPGPAGGPRSERSC